MHTKLGIPTSNNIADMQWTQSGTEGQCNCYMPPKLLWGHKYNFLISQPKTYVVSTQWNHLNEHPKQRLKLMERKYQQFYTQQEMSQ